MYRPQGRLTCSACGGPDRPCSVLVKGTASPRIAELLATSGPLTGHEIAILAGIHRSSVKTALQGLVADRVVRVVEANRRTPRYELS